MDGRITPDAGFTLIELMIAVTVLALLTTTVSLSVNRPSAGAGSDFARFQGVHARLAEQAVLSRQVLGLRVDADGYQRLAWRGGKWVSDGDRARWRNGVAVLQPFDLTAPLQFAPSGQVTRLKIRFEADEQVMICESDGWAGVSCGRG